MLVGHVTKDGALAGPRVLEHLVDCVLQFEGERERTYRILRALKNRFGATHETGVFEMRGEGLVEVLDASARFVDAATGRRARSCCARWRARGRCWSRCRRSSSPSELEQPRRVVTGVDRSRLALVLAVLARHGGVSLGRADVFVNVVGGVRIEEPGADLAVALAVASAHRGEAFSSPGDGGDAARPLGCFGELGLTGELRPVAHAERRVAEARKFGLDRVIAPREAGAGARGVPTLRAALAVAFADARGLATPPVAVVG